MRLRQLVQLRLECHDMLLERVNPVLERRDLRVLFFPVIRPAVDLADFRTRCERKHEEDCTHLLPAYCSGHATAKYVTFADLAGKTCSVGNRCLLR